MSVSISKRGEGGPPRYSVLMPFFERPGVLTSSLLAYDRFCRGNDFEIVVVDDHSQPDLRPDVPKGLGFDVVVVSLQGTKSGINPALPIEIGAQHARGEILVLTSPEIMPVRNFFADLGNEVSNSDIYKIFDVFALTDNDYAKSMTAQLTQPEIDSNSSEGRGSPPHQNIFEQGLGHGGYSYANSYGAWYQHHELKNEGLHFLSSISRSNFMRLGGFDLGFRKGAGYEDLEFRDRISKSLSFESIQGLTAVHLPHEEVSSRADIPISLNSNEWRYKLKKFFPCTRNGSKRELTTSSYFSVLYPGS